MKSSLQPSSLSTYQRAWNVSYQFLFHILPDSNSDMPVPPTILALLIAYLFDRHYAASSFNSYVLAIGYSHKLASLPGTTKNLFLLLRCSRVMKRSVLAWTAGYLLPVPCPFFKGSYRQPLNLIILFRVHFDFRLCAYLLFTHSKGWG